MLGRRQCLMAFLLIGLEVQVSGQGAIDLPPDVLTPAERQKPGIDSKIDGRVKVYEAASKRHLQGAHSSAKSEEFAKLGEHFQVWGNLISTSMDDIEKNIGRKKKSHALRCYEIHLRKAIDEMNKLKLTIPTDEDQHRESWVEKAEAARKRFVEILFALQS
jgi:hypothetical protein